MTHTVSVVFLEDITSFIEVISTLHFVVDSCGIAYEASLLGPDTNSGLCSSTFTRIGVSVPDAIHQLKKYIVRTFVELSNCSEDNLTERQKNRLRTLRLFIRKKKLSDVEYFIPA